MVKVGDEVKVKVLGFDDRGKVKLSMKRSTSRPARTSAASSRPPAGDDRDGKEQAAS